MGSGDKETVGAEGSLLPKIMLVEEDALSPELSLTMTSHLISSPRDAKAESKVKVALLPKFVLFVTLIQR